MNSRIRAGWPLVVVAALSALLAVGVSTFAGPCMHEDGAHGMCFDASQAVLGAGVVAFVAAIAGFAVKSSRVRGVLAIVSGLLGLFAALAPSTVFPLCMVQTMRCWTVMRPFAMVVGIMLAVFGVAAAIGAFRGKAMRPS